jgi:hypothetical protein
MSNIEEIRKLLAKIPYRAIQSNTSNIVEIQKLYDKRKESTK